MTHSRLLCAYNPLFAGYLSSFYTECPARENFSVLHNLADSFRRYLPNCAFYLESMHQSFKLLLCNVHYFLRCSRPCKSSGFQPLIQQNKAITLPNQALNLAALSATE